MTVGGGAMHNLDFFGLGPVSSSGTVRVDVIDSLTTWLQTGAEVFTAFALVIGAVWAYFRFRQDRIYMPRCSIYLNCSVATVESRMALLVDVGVTNCGDSVLSFETTYKARVEVYPINARNWSCAPAGDFIKWRKPDSLMTEDLFAHLDLRDKATGLEPGQDVHRSFIFVLPVDWAAAQVRILLKYGKGDKAPKWTATRVVVRPTQDKQPTTARRHNGFAERWIRR